MELSGSHYVEVGHSLTFCQLNYEIGDCVIAQSVWVLLHEELSEHISVNQRNIVNGLFLIGSLTHTQFVHTTMALWAIWLARRKAIHEKIFQVPIFHLQVHWKIH
jgi:hypothetical protein